MKILVSAYAFSPKLGSEFAQGWNYSIRMANLVDLTVLIGSSDGSMGDFDLIDRYMATFPVNFKIVKIYPDRICKVFNFLDRNLHLGWFFVLSLRRWNALAFRVAKELNHADNFDAVHHLGPLGFKNPGIMHKLGIPSYVGPIGGFQFINLRLAFKSSFKYFFIASLRNLLNLCFIYDLYIKKALKDYKRISYVTSSNKINFLKFIRREGPVISDQGAFVFDNELFLKKKKRLSTSKLIEICWCGSLDERKNVKLLIDIIYKLETDGIRCIVHIFGDGKLRNSLLKYLKNFSFKYVDNIYHGRLDRTEVLKKLSQIDLILFTSLSEANTATFYEALSNFVVPIALDLDGFHDNIRNNIGYLINNRNPYDVIVADYVSIINGLTKSKQQVLSHLESIANYYDEYTWDFVVKQHKSMLNQIVI